MSIYDFPYWPDDPRFDRTKHRLQMELDPVASASARRDLRVGTCLCGDMPATPPWDEHALFEVFDSHAHDVQVAIRQAAVDKTVADWNARHPVGTPVRYWTGAREGDGKTSRTRSTAYLLGASGDKPGHTPVVFVDGEGSCIALTHVQPLPVEYAVAFTGPDFGYGLLNNNDGTLFTSTDPEEANLRAMILRPAQEDRDITPDAVVVSRTSPDAEWTPVPRSGTCGTCGERFELDGPKFLVPIHEADDAPCPGALRYPVTFLPIETAAR